MLRLLPTYLTAAEMADRLYVTPNTVRTQIQALYGKLGATSRAEAVEAAIEIGLLEPCGSSLRGGSPAVEDASDRARRVECPTGAHPWRRHGTVRDGRPGGDPPPLTLGA